MSDRVLNVPYSNTLSEIEHAVESSRDEARRNRLHFHVESDEYFCHLSILLGCLAEVAETEEEFALEMRTVRANAVEAIRKDLLYLQTHFTVRPRETPA